MTKCVELSIGRSICNLVISHMNSDSAFFFEVCQLFEELNTITLPATSKRTNIQSDIGSSYYLTKEVKKQVHQIISKWFTKFNSGSLLSMFRLLVPEVKNRNFNIKFDTIFLGGRGESLLFEGKEIISSFNFRFGIRKFFKIKSTLKLE